MSRAFINQWVNYEVDGGIIMRAKVIDIEFYPGFKKPLFLMQNVHGNRFWLSRDEVI